jgi:AcrR family transcriptional regulator
MRVTRRQAAINHQRIVDNAIRLFAQRGVDGVGVAEVMAEAGFTHGGFYNHFASKDELVLEACSTSFARAVGSLRDGNPPQQAGDGDFAACLSAAMLRESSKGRPRGRAGHLSRRRIGRPGARQSVRGHRIPA